MQHMGEKKGFSRLWRAPPPRPQQIHCSSLQRSMPQMVSGWQGWDIDCVVPVPDGSRPAAIQISAELGLPYREGLVKNRYVGRTFIMPDQRCEPCC